EVAWSVIDQVIGHAKLLPASHAEVIGLITVVAGRLFAIFFFSSRRRHTRSYGDWSSDVCSSDLGPCRTTGTLPATTGSRSPRPRSEERRVGKECRARRRPEHEKNKGV